MTAAIAAAQYSISSAPPSTVQLHNWSIYKTAVGATATAIYTVSNSGNVVGTPGGILEAWLTGSGASSSSYEVMAMQSSGSAVSGTLGTWLNCGSDNAWSISNGARDNSVLAGVIAVQIRDVATHTVQASAPITISAESDRGLG